MRKERLSAIEEYINANGFVTMDRICEQFGIALPTVRKDIAELVSAGQIEKVYGGVKPIDRDKRNMHMFETRKSVNTEKKHIVAGKAAELISDNDIIYIDSGTTVGGIIDCIGDKHVTVITCNLAAVLAAANYDNIEVYALGGKLNKEIFAIENMFPFEFLKNFNIDKAFMASTGYSIEGGIAQDSPSECDIKRFILSISTEVYLTIDSSKIGRKALVKYAEADEIRNIITDDDIPEKYREYFRERNLNVL